MMLDNKILTNEQIESGDYNVNQVADLKMRLELSERLLLAIENALKNDQPKEAYELSVNGYASITLNHNHSCDGDVTLGSDGKYTCLCNLVQRAEF